MENKEKIRCQGVLERNRLQHPGYDGGISCEDATSDAMIGRKCTRQKNLRGIPMPEIEKKAARILFMSKRTQNTEEMSGLRVTFHVRKSEKREFIHRLYLESVYKL